MTNDNELDIRFSATTDKTTVVNLTHHSYFNLATQGSVEDHLLHIPANHITPVSAGLIPTGSLQAVKNTPFDFTQAKTIGKHIDEQNPQLKLGLGYDHNWVVDQQASGQLKLAARVTAPSSGRILEVLSTAPGIQFYSGNFLDGSLSGKGLTHSFRTGFCLEPQHFPDSPNQPTFPSTKLAPGEVYQNRILYRFKTQQTK